MKARKPLGQRYECPDCERQFYYQPETAEDSGPHFCPKCGADLCDNDPKIVPITKVTISTAKQRVPDQVYRQMESASAGRAEEAAAAAGVDVSEMSGMKITDLNDMQRPGDVAAKLPPNPAVEAYKNSTSLNTPNFQHQSNIAEFTRSIPNAGVVGHATRSMLNSNFAADASRLTSAGRINK